MNAGNFLKIWKQMFYFADCTEVSLNFLKKVSILLVVFDKANISITLEWKL